MVRQKSTKAAKLDTQLLEAIKGVLSGKFKSLYAAAKALGLNRVTVARCIAGHLSCIQARQIQQILSPEQESVLLKWIKQLTIGGYTPGHQLLREIAEEIRLGQRRDLYKSNTLPLYPMLLPPTWPGLGSIICLAIYISKVYNWTLN